MVGSILDDLLRTLDVRIHTFASCEVGDGHRLRFGPMGSVIVHYVLAGAGVLEVAGCAPVQIQARAIVVVPAGLAHGISAGVRPPHVVDAAQAAMAMSDGLMRFRAGEDDVELLTLCGAIDATVGGGQGLFEMLRAPLVEDVGGYPDFAPAFATLAREVSEPSVVSRPLTEAIMKQCLLLLIRAHIMNNQDGGFLAPLQDRRLGPAVLAILTNPGASHSLAGLARACAMSRSAFAKRFADVYRQTPFEFLQATRLHHAAHLLGVTDIPVKTIASAVGYSSRSHFSHAFRGAYGTDPSGFRANQRGVRDAGATH